MINLERRHYCKMTESNNNELTVMEMTHLLILSFLLCYDNAFKLHKNKTCNLEVTE